MKKLILLMLVAMVPYFTMAQKRSKKNKKVETETVASYEFMIISGYEMTMDGDRNNISISDAADITAHMKVKRLMQSKTKLLIEFDLGKMSEQEAQEEIELNEQSRNFRTMASAAQAADKRGWEFHSANVVVLGSARVHYYYMTRNK